MEFYCAPDGADSGGVCPPVPMFDGIGKPASMQLPLQAAAAPPAEADLGDDMELLERILREFHLGDAAEPVIPQPPAPTPAAAVMPPQPVLPAAGAPVGPGGALTSLSLEAPAGPAAPASLAPWAEEMVQRLQLCGSPAEASARCAEMLATFQQRAGADTGRMQRLQGANRVLLRALRSLNERHRAQQAERERAEQSARQLAAELERCQEALRASERARGQLQYHLQVMSNTPGTAAGGI